MHAYAQGIHGETNALRSSSHEQQTIINALQCYNAMMAYKSTL